MNSEGIECYDFFGVHIRMKWEEIRVCGVTGYDYGGTHYTYAFFSKIANEPRTTEQEILINRDRFLMEVSEKTVIYLKEKLPTEFYKRLIPALEQHKEAFYKR